MSNCSGCEFEGDCLVKSAMDLRGNPTYRGWRCAIYPCPDGMKAAEEALVSGESVIITVDGQEIQAYPFGTEFKPTDGSFDGVVVLRYVTPDRRIMVTIPERGTIFSGLTMDRLAQEWTVRK